MEEIQKEKTFNQIEMNQINEVTIHWLAFHQVMAREYHIWQLRPSQQSHAAETDTNGRELRCNWNKGKNCGQKPCDLPFQSPETILLTTISPMTGGW